jgi:hypothetical protein
VPFANRFPVGRLQPPVGLLRAHVRTLHELHLHLEPDVRSLPGVDLVRLAQWIGEVVGDAELAVAVGAAARSEMSYVGRCKAVHELVGRRLEAARAAVASAV